MEPICVWTAADVLVVVSTPGKRFCICGQTEAFTCAAAVKPSRRWLPPFCNVLSWCKEVRLDLEAITRS